jgi:hypothetical protein
MADATCNSRDNESVDRLANFAKSILKSFILLTIVICVFFIKGKYLPREAGEQPTIINLILFTLLGTVLLTILGVTDMYIFNNLVLGLGIGLGVRFFE